MNNKDLFKLSLNIIVIYLIVINLITIINKVLFPTTLVACEMAHNLLMVITGVTIWLILRRRETDKDKELKHLSFHIAGVIIITNGAYELINLVWENMSFIINSPQIMIGTVEISNWDHFWNYLLIVFPDIFPRLLVYLFEIVIGTVLFIVSKKFIEK